MNKLIAAVVASAFAFGAASTFAAGTVTPEPVKTQHQVRHSAHKVKHAKMHKVKYTKKAHHHHAKKAQRHQPK